MYLKVNSQDLSSIGSYFIEESVLLNKKLDSMISSLETLGTYWSGPDYDNYKEVYKTYLSNVKTTSIELNAYGNAIRKASEYYSSVNIDFGLKMRKMGVQCDRKQS